MLGAHWSSFVASLARTKSRRASCFLLSIGNRAKRPHLIAALRYRHRDRLRMHIQPYKSCSLPVDRLLSACGSALLASRSKRNPRPGDSSRSFHYDWADMALKDAALALVAEEFVRHFGKSVPLRRDQHSILINDQWRICFRWLGTMRTTSRSRKRGESTRCEAHARSRNSATG